MNDFLAALGLLLVIEGVLYACFPGVLRRALEMLDGLPEHQLRYGGLAAAIIGITIVWLVRR